MKIAVFDSGVGGFTVLRELRNRFPGHDYLYLGDNANVPYGTKSHQQIKNLTYDAAIQIKSFDVDLVVVACNTASCIAIEEMKKVMGDVPVHGVVEAGVSSMLHHFSMAELHSPILVLGTRATIRSQTYSKLLKQQIDSSVHVYEQECPLLVPMIEEGWTDHPILEATVKEYVRPYLDLQPGIAFLACTHYPHIRKVFERALPGWKIIDSAVLMAERLESVLTHAQSPKPGKLEFHFTDQESVAHRLHELVV